MDIEQVKDRMREIERELTELKEQEFLLTTSDEKQVKTYINGLFPAPKNINSNDNYYGD
jgi:hypothetical protein